MTTDHSTPGPHAHLWRLLDEQVPAACELRHHLHAHPELSGHEGATRDAVLAALPDGAVVDVADTGAVVRVGGPGPAADGGPAADSVGGPVVGVRGEMDALPVDEATGAAFASTRDGVMHACGHDVHLAAVVALARTLAHPDAHAPAPLLVVLQPREETYPSGAQDIVRSGVLHDQGCTAMIGAHVQPTLPAGTVACVPGGVNASADELTITVRGQSGHAAYPHLTRDPVLALASIVVALQSLVSRVVDPMEPAVVGISSLQAGEPANVVPDTAVARGTIRALSTHTRDLLHERIRAIVPLVAEANGCTADVGITRGEPVLDNDPHLAAAAAHHLDVGAGLAVDTTLRSAGADDFSFYSEHIPTLMMFVGTATDEALHSATFLPDDAAVRDTARAMLAGYLAACG